MASPMLPLQLTILFIFAVFPGDVVSSRDITVFSPPKKGSSHLGYLPNIFYHDKPKPSFESFFVIIGVIVGMITFLFFIFFVWCKCYNVHGLIKFKRIRGLKRTNEMVGDEGGNGIILAKTLRHVIDNFNPQNVLGKGGFGIVYKVDLPDGTTVAIKRMSNKAMGGQGIREFEAEISLLSKVRHRHLVPLLGYYIDRNEKLLVYEYMSQGALSRHLFKWREHGLPPLTWKQRLTIALDVTKGLEYMHTLAQQSFIHRDLKPENILLGDDMRAKVADFGLVKNVLHENYSMEVTHVAGTHGYIAPEYALTGRVTTKIDVYAFGVILMELITGRKALDTSLPEERFSLVTWLGGINKENFKEVIDPNIDANEEETYNNMWKVAELATQCTAEEPHQRPDMAHVAHILSPLVEQWKPSEEYEGYEGIDLEETLSEALQRWKADDEGTSRMLSDCSELSIT